VMFVDAEARGLRVAQEPRDVPVEEQTTVSGGSCKAVIQVPESGRVGE